MEERTIIFLIVLFISLLILGAICIAVFGKHYTCDNNKCQYNYFKFDGMSKDECSVNCIKKVTTEFDNKDLMNNSNKYTCNENTGVCTPNGNGKYLNKPDCENNCNSPPSLETRYVLPTSRIVNIYQRYPYRHLPYHHYPRVGPPGPPGPPGPSVHPVPEPVVPEPVVPEPVAPEPVAPEPVAPEPVAPEPVAPEMVAPEPVAPEITPPNDPIMEAYNYYY